MKTITLLLSFTFLTILSNGQTSSDWEFTASTIEMGFFDGEKVVSVIPQGKDVRIIFDPLLKTLIIAYTGVDFKPYSIFFSCTNSFGENLNYEDRSGFKISVNKSFLADGTKDGLLVLMGTEVMSNQFLTFLALKNFTPTK
jgi:hypothetical protein